MKPFGDKAYVMIKPMIFIQRNLSLAITQFQKFYYEIVSSVSIKIYVVLEECFRYKSERHFN